MYQRVGRERRMFGKEGGRKRDGGTWVTYSYLWRRKESTDRCVGGGTWEVLKGESKESYQSFISAYES